MTTTVKINKTSISVNGERIGVSYFTGPWVAGVPADLIKIRPRRKYSFPASFHSTFGEIENNSDLMTDYFERDAIPPSPQPSSLCASKGSGRPMTPAQFRAAIEKLGLSQERAGLWLGRSARQGQRWATGDTPIPESVAKLLRLVIRLGLKPDDVK